MNTLIALFICTSCSDFSDIVINYAFNEQLVTTDDIKWYNDQCNDFKLVWMRELQRKWNDLQDSPPVEDVYRLVDVKTIDAYLAFNVAYCNHLKNLAMVRPHLYSDIQSVLEEANRLYYIWSVMRDAQIYSNAYSSNHYYKRVSLKKFRDLVGCKAYYNAEWPPYVPICQFKEIK